MTPKEKAKELVEKYREYAEPIMCDGGFMSRGEGCKRCALIAVDEIDLLLQRSSPKDDPYANLLSLEYWQDVKKEIELL